MKATESRPPIPVSAGRLIDTAKGDPSEPMPAIAIPALVMDVVTEQYGPPIERCIDDCVILTAA